MKVLLRLVKTALVLAQGAVLGLCVWTVLESSRVAAVKSRPVLIEIEKGWGVHRIAEALKKEGVLTKTTPFIWRYRMNFSGQGLKAGQYELSVPSAPQAVIDALVKGLVYLHPLTVAEGLTAREAFPVLIQAGFGTVEAFEAAFTNTAPLGLLDPRAENLEGYLFPETYRLPKGIAPAAILKTMVEQFKSVFAEPWRRRAAELGMSVRDAVILASLIEKETGRLEEKSLVSSVFHNRLRLGMKLDCDPTIIYALKLRGAYDGRIHSKDLRDASPYNTYVHSGLPPGPICNPGRASLQAALNPAETDYLYFVSRNDGSHQFSRTFREHSRAVSEYQR